MVTYYIYHIPGIKIGCTKQLAIRMSQQGFTEWEILETHTDGWLAGDREIELQKEYGLPVDTVHYMVSLQNRKMWTKEEARIAGIKGGREAGRLAKESGQFIECAKAGGKVAGKMHRDLTFDQAQEIRAKYTGKRGEQSKLAKEYDVTHSTIWLILKNKTYLES